MLHSLVTFIVIGGMALLLDFQAPGLIRFWGVREFPNDVEGVREYDTRLRSGAPRRLVLVVVAAASAVFVRDARLGVLAAVVMVAALTAWVLLLGRDILQARRSWLNDRAG